ncbi:MAG: MotE family protein [Caulobacterales bacterium]
MSRPPASQVRLMPALIATMGVVLAMKAVAAAEAAGDRAPAPAASNAKPAGAARPPPSAAAPATPATQAAPANQCPAPSFADQAGLSQSEVRVLQTLGDRRKAIDARAAEIDKKADLLSAAEKRVDERIAELKKLEASLEGMLGKLDAEQEQRILGLVNVYQKMRAKDAAAVFNGLDDEVLLEVAARMKQANLADIMGQMSPERTRKLTKMLAESKRPPALAPTPAANPAPRPGAPARTSN